MAKIIMDTATLHSLMTQSRYGVVSSTARDGKPQSALVGLAVTPELEVIFDTLKSSRKYPNLVERPWCSLVMLLDGEQTIQLEGIAAEPAGTELKRCQEVYFAAWPGERARLSWPGIAYFAVRPRWVRYSDYGVNPPLIEEITLPVRTVESPSDR